MAQVIACPDLGLSNDPSNFLNRVDRNCIPYTVPELILFAGGCLLWVAAYALLIRNMRREHFSEMAAIAGCSNFAWEFLWSFFFFTDMGYFLVWTYRAWFFLDIFIFSLLLRYGAGQVSSPFLKKHFVPLSLLGVLGFGIVYYFFTREGHDTFIGANSAYIAQLFISVFCLLLLIEAPGLAGFSAAIGWLRSVGTGMNTVFMLMHYRGDHFLHAMALISLALDASYLMLFHRKAQGAASAAAPPGRLQG
jgi:hypothetical protein